MRIIDSHAHLEFEDYSGDLEDVLERALKAGVGSILSVSCLNNENDGSELASIIRRYSGAGITIYSAFGVHPHDAVDWHDQVGSRLSDLCELPSTLALGEIGLDFYYLNSPADIQERAFIEQIKLAHALNLPLIVHSRDAESETLAILKQFCADLPGGLRGVVHCYTGSAEAALELLDLGFYLSFGGMVTFKKAAEIREVIEQVPLDRILLETDSPFLAPVPKRGKRNEPSYLPLVAEKIAGIKNLSYEEVAEQTTKNFSDLFLNSQHNNL